MKLKKIRRLMGMKPGTKVARCLKRAWSTIPHTMKRGTCPNGAQAVLVNALVDYRKRVEFQSKPRATAGPNKRRGNLNPMVSRTRDFPRGRPHEIDGIR